MTADILKVKKQLADINMLLKQGKLLAAVATLQEASGFMLKTQLMKHEIQTFTEALDKAVFLLSSDRELQKIYPLQISYTPGEEKELQGTLTNLLELLQDDLTEEANAHLEELLERRKKQLEVVEKLLQDEEVEKARRASQRLIEKARTDQELRKRLAEIFFAAGLYEDALEHMVHAYSDSQNAAATFSNIATHLRREGHLEAAEKYYLQALEGQGKDASIYFNLGRVYLDMKRWLDAASAAERASSLNPEFQEARKMKIYAERKLKEL